MNWLENDNEFRPLQMAHRLVSDPDQPLDEALEQIRKKLQKIKDIGCGGIVTNVCFTEYLENEHFWEILQHTMRICKEMGLRVWLYDEKGYPSGGAGGIIVRDTPEYEAYGLVCLEYPVKKTTHLVVDLPRGHERVIAAYAVSGEFDGQSSTERIELAQFIDESGTLCWDSTVNGTVYYIVSKVLFEGVHAARNYHQVRRYIDVLDKNAMKRFIEITYENYKKYVGEYFGDLIEAVFTDEPSVMGSYSRPLTGARLNEPTLNEPDETIPLYAYVVWSRSFAEEFSLRKGYDIVPLVPWLFKGDSKEARRVRHDYHEVAAQLYEEAYFKAIGEFCAENNIKFTGHLLGEELLLGHIINEYDYFQMMRNMQYTGIDMLTADPKRVVDVPLLPKIASSVAHQYGMKKVMSESSDFTEKQNNEPTPPDRVFASFAAQYACGINQITSYFSEEKFTASEYKSMYDAVSRMGQLLAGGVHQSPLLVYYPARSGWQYNLPTDQIGAYRDYDKNFWLCSASLSNALKAFGSRKLDYDVTDKNGLYGCDIKDGYMQNAHGERYSAVYVSAVDFAVEDIADRLIETAEKGVTVYIERSVMPQNSSCVEQLSSNERLIWVEDADKAAQDIYARGLNDISINSPDAENIVYLHKLIDGQHRYMLINVSDNDISVSIDFKYTSRPTVFDVVANKEKNAEINITSDSTSIRLTFEKYQVIFVIFE